MEKTLEKKLDVVSFESKDDSRKYRSKKRKERKLKIEKGEKVKRVAKREYREETSDVDSDDSVDDLPIPNIKKVKNEKVEKVDTSDKFTSVLGSILSKQPTSVDGPILAKYKKADKLLEEEEKAEKDLKKRIKEKKDLGEKDHRQIEILISSSERDLMKTAKRGVIKLFNAVAKHQKEANQINIEDEPKLSKNQFLDKLKTKSSDSTTKVKTEVKEESNSDDDEDAGGEQWDGLNEDYMLDTNNKQWESYDNQDE